MACVAVSTMEPKVNCALCGKEYISKLTLKVRKWKKHVEGPDRWSARAIFNGYPQCEIYNSCGRK